jgi:hypothetical protein
MIVQEMEQESHAFEISREDVARLDSMARQRDRLEDELRFRQARLKAITRALEERGVSVGAVHGGEDAHDAHEAHDAHDAEAPEHGAGEEAPREPDREPDSEPPRRQPRRLTALPIASTETVSSLEAERQWEKRAIERIRGALRDLEEESRKLSRQVDETFHPFWGSIFKLGVELSSFGDQVENYACLYTSRVSNLLSYSPLHYFRSPRDFMPHEIP